MSWKIRGLIVSICILAGICASGATSNQIEPAGNVVEPRVGQTATALLDGRVLIVGGANTNGVLASAELFDAALTNSFAPTGPLNVARQGHTATRLADGRVLIAGGQNEGAALASVELYD